MHYQGYYHEQCGLSPVGNTEKHTVSVDREFGSSLAGLFWLAVFRKVAIRCQLRLSTGLLEYPHSMAAGFHKASDPRDQNGMCGTFHDVALRVTHGLFLHMLLVTQTSSDSIWKRLHEGMNSRKRGLLGSSWRLAST